jgi:hypothetical protein
MTTKQVIALVEKGIELAEKINSIEFEIYGCPDSPD